MPSLLVKSKITPNCSSLQIVLVWSCTINKLVLPKELEIKLFEKS